MNVIISLLFAVFFFIGSSVTGVANDKPTVIDGVIFEPVYISNEETLILRGAATLRYLVMIKAYTGALYLPDEVPREYVLEDFPKRLVLEYFHEIKAGDFADATQTMIERNITPDELEIIRDELNLLKMTFKDVRPKDRYALTYRPGYGTELTLNDKPLQTFNGALFAKALFSVWLGDQPIDKDFRDRLTGKK